MAWPTGSVSTTHLDAGTDDPSQARADILDMAQKVNDMISNRGTIDGVASLDGSALVPASQIPLATTSARGGAEFATNTEVRTDDATRIMNPTNHRDFHNRYAIVKRSGNQSIPNNSQTIIDWNGTEYADTDGWHSTVTNPSRITVNHTGLYVISACVAFSANATGYRQLLFFINGILIGNLPVDQKAGESGLFTYLNGTGIYNLSAGDYLETSVYQNSGAALDMGGGLSGVHFAVAQIG